MNILKCFYSRIYFFCLYLIFKFERWHFKSTYHCTPYKKNVVKLVNKNINVSESIVEIGCGLGEIIKRIDCHNRYGIDRCKKVINAARYINRSDNITFLSESFYDLNIKIDHVILINFTHQIPQVDLIKMINEIILKLSPKTFFLDAYHKNYFKHLRHHNFTKIFNNFKNYKLIQKKLSDDGKRYFYVFKKTN